MRLITVKRVPYEGELLPAGLSGQITGEGDFPGSYRVLLDNDQLPKQSNDVEVELVSDDFITTSEKANAATP